MLMMSLLLAPPTSWAACDSKKEGTLSLDCSAASQALNNPAVSGVTLLPQSDASVASVPIRLVRPNEILDMSEKVSSIKANTPKDTASVLATPDASKAENQKNQSKAPKKSAN
jgi:hypothetical protein